MVEASVPRRRVSCAGALPCIEANVMVVAAGGEKGRCVADSSHHLKAENVTVKLHGAIKICHFQMNVANARFVMERHMRCSCVWCRERDSNSHGIAPAGF